MTVRRPTPASEVKQHRAAKSPGTDDGDSGRTQPCLSVGTDFFHAQVPRMAGESTPRDGRSACSVMLRLKPALHQSRPDIPCRPR